MHLFTMLKRVGETSTRDYRSSKVSFILADNIALVKQNIPPFGARFTSKIAPLCFVRLKKQSLSRIIVRACEPSRNLQTCNDAEAGSALHASACYVQHGCSIREHDPLSSIIVNSLTISPARRDRKSCHDILVISR